MLEANESSTAAMDNEQLSPLNLHINFESPVPCCPLFYTARRISNQTQQNLIEEVKE